MRKRSISLIVPCLLLTLASAVAEERAIPVTLARTQARRLLITARITGELQSLAYPTIAAEIDGRILSIQVDEGQGVHAGQLLALLDAERFMPSLWSKPRPTSIGSRHCSKTTLAPCGACRGCCRNSRPRKANWTPPKPN
jgi:hypothetical protein